MSRVPFVRTFARQPRGGFSLPEVALTVLVLALGITTALAAMQRGFMQFDLARSVRLAGNILQAEMEKERLLPWAQVSDAGYRPVIDAALLRNPDVAPRFTLSRTVAPVADRGADMVQVTLTVTWRARDGQNVSRSHLTYFCRGGLYNFIHDNV